MGLHLHSLQALSLVPIMLAFVSKSISTPSRFPIAKRGCVDHCGNVSIPFPFGTTEGCYYNSSFLVTCNDTHYDPPIAFLTKSSINITDISLNGQVRIWQFIAKSCYSQNGTRVLHNSPWTTLSRGKTVNHIANKFISIGCDTYGFVYGYQTSGHYYETGCTSVCTSKADLLDVSCSGIGCCKTSIPKQVQEFNMTAKSYNNFTTNHDDNPKTVWNFNNCSYAMLVEDKNFTFSASLLSSLMNVDKLPMVVDWAVGEGTCAEAKKNMSSYACKSVNSTCYKPDNGNGYRCDCDMGYEGNPYLVDGCKDINECQDPTLNICVSANNCVNTEGGFYCTCPKGYHGDGLMKDGHGCMRNQSSLVLKLVIGIALGIIILFTVACGLYFQLLRRKINKMKQKFFLQNGGVLLQEKLIRRDKTTDTTKIFACTELKKATNNFHDSRIVGQGGFGIVYKGFLPDNRIVAIKKSREVDPNQVEQFINEVIVLSQINHRNVVKLLGCCLETQAPLLVYEFIDNGTLFEHIHNKENVRSLSWDIRLRIAAETAGVLAYLHSAASPPIIHRDIKSANILLDASFTAKVSDFGASRLVPNDQTQLCTMLQGTFGYLDPEYMQTNQLTEKSDVYSFGVVLAELLTGKKAVSYKRAVEDRSLANFFLSTMSQNRLFQVLDDNIVCEGNSEELTEVAKLAERCLHVRGEDRPCMKEVAMGLEGLRLSRQHSWLKTTSNVEEMEYLLPHKMNDVGIPNGDDGSSSTNFDSMRNHIILPMDGAR